VSILGKEQASAIAPLLKGLVENANPDDWQNFAAADEISRVRMGDAQSWPRSVIEPLLRTHNLDGADLRGAPLRHTDLSNLNFAGADLTDADLVHTNMHGTNFSGATIGGVNCVGPLMNSYSYLHETPDSFRTLLHPMVE
ncbi:pentapeptide repeat-containing protein, partial [Stenotrophomonas maltophilia]|uniref:pentapeptide repeat-containing protein n=1 Tax=Stenotrophomonas maltophilia TaxID=40324 RepID=UPI003BF776D0